MIVTIIGTGLIGGSMALAFREKGFAELIIGVDANEVHAKRALELKLVDKILPLEEAVRQSDRVILAVPVNAAEQLLPGVMDLVDRQVVMDVGSTKVGIIQSIEHHPHRRRFIPTHPMWGTEYSGPDAAITGAFVNKAAVITNKNDSDADAVELIESVYK